MGRVQDADFRLFIGDNRLDHLHADRFQIWAGIAEVVLHHPLDKGLAHYRRLIVNAGLRFDTGRQIGRRTRGDAVHHGIRTGGIRGHPVNHRLFAGKLQELHHPVEEALTVMPHVVAVEQGQRPGVVRHALFQNSCEGAVNGFAFAFQVGLQIGVAGFQLMAGVQVVPPFRHGKGDNFCLRIGPFVDQRLQPGLPRQQFLNRGDFFIFALPFRADGLQHVTSSLRRQRLHHLLGVVADIARRDAPALIPGSHQTMQIPRLMRAMKRTQTNVKPCELIVHVLLSLS